MTQSNPSSRDQLLKDHSSYLREYSTALRQQARDLCERSQRLRAEKALLAAAKTHPKATGYRGPMCAIVLRLSGPEIRFSIDVPLRKFEQNSNERSSKILDETKILY